jgi:hypothetical protein
MSNAILNVLGFLLIILSLYSILNPAYPINFISHDYRTMNILDTPSNNSTYNFNFTPALIYKYYEKLDNNLDFVGSVDIYVNEFLDNSSSKNLTGITLNNDFGVPQNKSYCYSFVYRQSTLKEYNTLVLNKSTSLIINRVDITYYGTDFNYYNTFKNWFMTLYLCALIFGIALLIA